MKRNMPQFVQKVLTLSSFGIQQIVFRFDDNIRQHLKLPSAVATHVHVGPVASSPFFSLPLPKHPICTECPFELSRLPFIDKYCTGMCLPASLVRGGQCVFFLPLFFASLLFHSFFVVRPPFGVRNDARLWRSLHCMEMSRLSFLFYLCGCCWCLLLLLLLHVYFMPVVSYGLVCQCSMALHSAILKNLNASKNF